MQIKTIMRYHFTPVRVASIRKTSNKCWEDVDKKESLVHCQWDYKLVQSLWKTVWRSSQQKYYMIQQFQFWVFFQRKQRYQIKIIHVLYIHCTSFKTVNTWKQSKSLPIDKWTKKMNFTHTHKHTHTHSYIYTYIQWSIIQSKK